MLAIILGQQLEEQPKSLLLTTGILAHENLPAPSAVRVAAPIGLGDKAMKIVRHQTSVLIDVRCRWVGVRPGTMMVANLITRDESAQRSEGVVVQAKIQPWTISNADEDFMHADIIV